MSSASNSPPDEICSVVADMALEQIITETFGRRPLSFTAKELGQNQGFMSFIIRISMEWPPSHGDDCKVCPQSAILKRITGKKLDENEIGMDYWFGVLHQGHNHECYLYEFVNQAPALEMPLDIPRLYACQQNIRDDLNGWILMEDLSATTSLADFVEGLSLQALERIFDNFAGLHAYCVKNRKWLSELAEDLPFWNDPENMNLQIETMRKNYSDFYKFTDEEMEFVTKPENMEIYFHYNPSRDFFPVITHYDLWANNILLENENETDNSSNPAGNKKVYMIDWQLCQKGPPAYDMISLMCHSVDAEIRRTHAPGLLARYHKELTRLLAKDGIPVPLSLNQLVDLYDQFAVVGSWYATVHLATFLDTLGLGADAKKKMAYRVVAAVEDGLASVRRRRAVEK